VTGGVEEAFLDMCLLEISMRRIADVTEALSGVRIGKDTVSRIVERPGEAEGLAEEAPRREGIPLPLLRRHLPEARWGASVINLTLLDAVMNSIRNGLGKRRAGTAGDPTNQRIRIPMRFTPRFNTRCSSRGGRRGGLAEGFGSGGS
jgi:hypothetical protein